MEGGTDDAMDLVLEHHGYALALPLLVAFAVDDEPRQPSWSYGSMGLFAIRLMFLCPTFGVPQRQDDYDPRPCARFGKDRHRAFMSRDNGGDDRKAEPRT